MTPTERRRRRVTLLDVAKAAGVSRATASLVIRKSPLVGAETRSRVEAAIAALGYVYDLGAARLRAARSHTVGVIVPNLINPFFAELLAGIEGTLDRADRVVIVANSRESVDHQDVVIRRMREHGVDGLIVCPATGTTAQLLADAETWGAPLVQALRHVSASEGDFAGVDSASGMAEAVDHLAALGHRRIAFVAGEAVHSAHWERLAGFRAAMARRGLADDLILRVPSSHSAAVAAVDLLLRHPGGPTAAICHNDIIALGIAGGLADRGIAVGPGFSVIGFDNVPEDEIVHPKLTSVATHPVEIGASAASLLLARLADPQRPVERIAHPTRLVERQSCGPAPAAAERSGRLGN